MTRTWLIITRATSQPCPRCHRDTLVAFDEGLQARVDPQPIDHTGEIAALLDNRWTYTLTPGGELVHRDASRITDPNLHGAIHAEHKCPPSSHQGALF